MSIDDKKESRREFEKRMMETYPLLYDYMYGNPRVTCMAFGFDIGPGWYPLIEEMSEELTPHIEEEYKKAIKEQKACYGCGYSKKWHWFWCIIYTIRNFFLNKKERIKVLINKQERKRAFRFALPNKKLLKMVKYLLFFKNFRYRVCKRFKYSYPRAAQIKEKFGTLRAYMTWSTEEMDEIIDKYEDRSGITCETCGQPGKLRGKAWVVTLCDSCAAKK